MSPIKGMTPRLAEAGRIRIGQTVPAEDRDGNATTRPDKLETFRFTSHDEAAIRQIAELYGGEAQHWVGNIRTAVSWEVITEAKAVPIFLPPSGVAFSQWYEEWSGAGCIHRCDGEHDEAGGGACECDPDNRSCKPTTRVSLILADVQGSGVWRFETHSDIAGRELAGALEIADVIHAPGRLCPGRLVLEMREIRKPGEKPKQFPVARLDLDVNLGARAQQQQLEAPTRAELPPPGPLAINAQTARTFVKDRVGVLGPLVGEELAEKFGPADQLDDAGWCRVADYLREHHPLREEPF